MKPICWQPGPREPDGMSTTCWLRGEHEEHVWTRDDQITFTIGSASVDFLEADRRLGVKPV